MSSLVLPTSSLCRIVTALTALVLLSLVHSERLLSYEVLPEQVSNVTHSGVAKSARVIAVKVLGDNGCVYYPPPRILPVLVLLSIDLVAGPMRALLFHKKLVFWTEIRIPNSISGIDWVAKAAKNSSRPSVASLSFGGDFSASVNAAAANLVSSGVTTVVSAGNNDVDANLTSPASEPSVITVGASNIVDSKADYSNWGTVIDIWAPGTQELMSRSPKSSHPFAQDPTLSPPGKTTKPNHSPEPPGLPPMSPVILLTSLASTLH